MSSEAMVDEQPMVAEEQPKKIVIGSHLSFEYKEDTNPSGFICGGTFILFFRLSFCFGTFWKT